MLINYRLIKYPYKFNTKFCEIRFRIFPSYYAVQSNLDERLHYGVVYFVLFSDKNLNELFPTVMITFTIVSPSMA